MLPTYRRISADRRAHRAAFTLLEVLIATVVTLILTALVVQMFSVLSESIFNSRANIELSDQLRNAKHRLIQDLRGATAPTVPPVDPCSDFGYLEYVEGGNVANTWGGDFGSGTISGSGSLLSSNTLWGDLDDILMFTTCSFDEPFVGRQGIGAVRRARYAEVAWFVRPVPTQSYCNLYREVLLVDPRTSISNTAVNFIHRTHDLSVHRRGGNYERHWATNGTNAAAYGHDPHTDGSTQQNTLGMLTDRQHRTMHQPWLWPYDMMYTALLTTTSGVPYHRTIGTSFDPTTPGRFFWPQGTTPILGLPVLVERCRGITTTTNGFTHHGITTTTSMIVTTSDRREHEDLMLTNVISFDIKAWDPGAPVFRAAPPENLSGPESVGLIVPGDVGYGGGSPIGGSSPQGALQNFCNNHSSPLNQPVAFGAFVDLNFMWMNGQSGNANVKQTTSLYNRYLSALSMFELTSGLVRTDGIVRLPRPSFACASPGRLLSGYPGDDVSGYQYPSVYDTWSRGYEYDGVDNDGDGLIDEGSNGIDDNGNGYVDEPLVGVDTNEAGRQYDGYVDAYELYLADQYGERDAPPPWDAPLRGIKVTIRVMEQDSLQVREISTVHEFIPF